MLKQTANLAQGTAELANQVVANQELQHSEVVNNAATSEDSKIEKLRNLKSLLDSGVLTAEEFETEKHKILNS